MALEPEKRKLRTCKHKKRTATILCTTLVILLIPGIVGYCLYEVIWFKLPYTKNLLRAILVVCALLGTLAKLLKGTGRKSLSGYEKAYADELGNAFCDDPSHRKKLLCACRLFDESKYGKALKYLLQLLQEAELRRDTVPVLLFIALCYTDAGVTGEAIKTYLTLLKSDPYNSYDVVSTSKTYRDLRHLADDKTVLENPHKGWYYHFLDNGYYRLAQIQVTSL